VILVDTDVLSETTRKEPARAVLACLSRHAVVGLSAVSVMERDTGTLRASAGDGPSFSVDL
jgi:predicted nucleic acid-binding protein